MQPKTKILVGLNNPIFFSRLGITSGREGEGGAPMLRIGITNISAKGGSASGGKVQSSKLNFIISKKMNKGKILKSVFVILGVATIAAGASYALYQDSARVLGTTFSSGDADLKIKMPDNGCVEWSDNCSGVSWSGIYPGWNQSYNLYLKNISGSPIILQIVPVIVETGSVQALWDNTYMEIICAGNDSTGRYSLTAWKSNAAVEIDPRLSQNEEAGPCEVKFDIPETVGNEIANASIGFDLVLNANQAGAGTVAGDETCEQTNGGVEICGNGIDEDCDGSDLVCPATCTPTNDGVEICDGIDNDCDVSSADGSEDPQLGSACDGPDTDLCMEGTKSCSGGALTCSDTSGDTTEVCGNGIDDDCDGSVDEGCPTCVPITEICGDGIDQDCSGSDLACTQCASDAQCPMPNSCTTGACVSGTCVYTPHDFMCFNMNSCIAATCGAQTGCNYLVTSGIGTPCSDMNCITNPSGGCSGYTCNINGACVAGSPTGGCTGVCIFGGTCTGGVLTCDPNPNCPNNCDDSNFCTIDSCILTGCVNAIETCDDGNELTYDACDPTNGQCSNFPLPTFEYSPCFVLPWGGQWCFGD